MMIFELQSGMVSTYTPTTQACFLESLSHALRMRSVRPLKCLLMEQITEAVRGLWPSIADSPCINPKECRSDGSLVIRELKNGIEELKLSFKQRVALLTYSDSGDVIMSELKVCFRKPLRGSRSQLSLSLSIKVGSGSLKKCRKTYKCSYKSTIHLPASSLLRALDRSCGK